MTSVRVAIGLDGRKIDVVDIEQEVLRVGVVQLDEAGEGGAVVAVIGFLDVAGLLGAHLQEALDVGPHARVDLGEEVGIRSVERVV